MKVRHQFHPRFIFLFDQNELHNVREKMAIDKIAQMRESFEMIEPCDKR